MTLYEQALKIACAAHKDQVRKHDSSPYVVHPIMVAKKLEKAGFDEKVVAAGLLHDVIEDTDVKEEDLREQVGDEIIEIVTAVSEEKELEWEERKEKYVEAVVAAGESVWAVSVADKIHNAESFIENYQTGGRESWSVFNRGKDKKLWFEEMLYEALCKVWDHELLRIYRERLDTLKTLDD